MGVGAAQGQVLCSLPGMFSGLLVLMGSWRGMCAAAWSGLEEDGLVPWFLLLPFPQTD